MRRSEINFPFMGSCHAPNSPKPLRTRLYFYIFPFIFSFQRVRKGFGLYGAWQLPIKENFISLRRIASHVGKPLRTRSFVWESLLWRELLMPVPFTRRGISSLHKIHSVNGSREVEIFDKSWVLFSSLIQSSPIVSWKNRPLWLV